AKLCLFYIRAELLHNNGRAKDIVARFYLARLCRSDQNFKKRLLLTVAVKADDRGAGSATISPADALQKSACRVWWPEQNYKIEVSNIYSQFKGRGGVAEGCLCS